jgi:[protein-PII] uridylyltransferase
MSLRARRQELIERTDLKGDAFCSAAADEWLTGLFDTACEGDARGMALVAVGGYGRGELCPFSDLDVVIIHKGRKDISAVAERIWYPVWDEGIALDHSVRKPNEALEMAADDLRVALGLLDARVICGEQKVAEPVLGGARERWIRQKPPWLGVLAEKVAERHASNGDVGFLLEPDLKESHGGLRDIAALVAMMEAVPVLST